MYDFWLKLKPHFERLLIVGHFGYGQKPRWWRIEYGNWLITNTYTVRLFASFSLFSQNPSTMHATSKSQIVLDWIGACTLTNLIYSRGCFPLIGPFFLLFVLCCWWHSRKQTNEFVLSIAIFFTFFVYSCTFSLQWWKRREKSYTEYV